MTRRGRQPGYQNYSIDEQLLLCSVADKFKPLGRNMWEDAAAEYNDRRARGWVRRDYESLKRKFRSLYSKGKPTGFNGDLPPRLVPIAQAQEIQRAIEEKAGAHTMNDGFDQGEDDNQLPQDVNATEPMEEAHDPAGLARDEVVVGSGESLRDEEEGDADVQEDSQASHQATADESLPDSSPLSLRRAVGTVITSHGIFDASLGDDVWSEPEDAEDEAERSQTSRDQPASGHLSPVQPEPIASTPVLIVENSAVASAKTGTSTPANIGRPKRGSKRGKAVRPTQASPEGPVLSRDPNRALADAIEMQRNPKKNTASNRLGGVDLRVVRDNVEELTGTGNKRQSSDSFSSGATYAVNKRARAKKRLEQMQKELDETVSRQYANGGEMMQYLVFMREEADRRAAEEDRRREDREAKQEADKLEREERERVRREEVAAAEVRRSQELELTRTLREDQIRKEAAAAEENRRRYEERLERERAEAQQRHEQIMLLMTAMQRGSRDTS